MVLRIMTSKSIFDEIVGDGYLYVDKTQFLTDWWKAGEGVTLITRPRRFGKSLLLSTVECFFDPGYRNAVKKDGSALFEGLNVWKDHEMQALHGTIPVISMSLSGVKQGNPDAVYKALSSQIYLQFGKFQHAILNSDNLSEGSKHYFHEYLLTGNSMGPGDAFQLLCQDLTFVYGNKPVLLLDEYDTPLTEAFVEGTLDEVVKVLRIFFVAAYKDNPYFSKCLMTGITRIAQQSLFSDFNNPCIDTMLRSRYPYTLGYTDEEVRILLKQAGLESEYDLVKEMYDGYTVEDARDIYNPYSLNCFLANRVLDAYWINTSGNALAREVIRNGSSATKAKIIDLMEGKSLITKLPENLNYKRLYREPDSALSLLFSAGFLKLNRVIRKPADGLKVNRYQFEVTIPNDEVRDFYVDVCENWFGESMDDGNEAAEQFVSALLLADKTGMTESLSKLILSSVGEQDAANNPVHPPENFYHGLVLGLMGSLHYLYSVKSNGPGGEGRYDITLFPRLDNERYKSGELFGFCVEFKVRDRKTEPTLVHTIHRAIDQIRERQYIQPLLDLGVPANRVKCFGIAFDGKKVLVGDGTEALPGGAGGGTGKKKKQGSK